MDTQADPPPCVYTRSTLHSPSQVAKNQPGKPDPRVGGVQMPGASWRTETYAVKMHLVQEILDTLQVPVPTCDAFSLAKSRRFEKFWGPDSPWVQDAFSTSWNVKDAGFLWINPPFSKLSLVVHKIKQDHAHWVLVAPCWEQEDWYRQLETVTVKMTYFRIGEEVFELVGEDYKVPPVKWAVIAAQVCGRPKVCSNHPRSDVSDKSKSSMRMSRRKRWQILRVQEGVYVANPPSNGAP